MKSRNRKALTLVLLTHNLLEVIEKRTITGN